MAAPLKRALQRLSKTDLKTGNEHFVSAAILFHAVPIDGIVRDQELEALHRILMEDLDLEERNVTRLVQSARKSDKRSEFFAEIVDFAKSNLTYAEKKNLISQLWEVVFSDGHLHETESNLVLQVGIDIGIDVEEACGLMTSNSL